MKGSVNMKSVWCFFTRATIGTGAHVSIQWAIGDPWDKVLYHREGEHIPVKPEIPLSFTQGKTAAC